MPNAIESAIEAIKLAQASVPEGSMLWAHYQMVIDDLLELAKEIKGEEG